MTQAKLVSAESALPQLVLNKLGFKPWSHQREPNARERRPKVALPELVLNEVGLDSGLINVSQIHASEAGSKTQACLAGPLLNEVDSNLGLINVSQQTRERSWAKTRACIDTCHLKQGGPLNLASSI